MEDSGVVLCRGEVEGSEESTGAGIQLAATASVSTEATMLLFPDPLGELTLGEVERLASVGCPPATEGPSPYCLSALPLPLPLAAALVLGPGLLVAGVLALAAFSFIFFSSARRFFCIASVS